MRRGMLALLGIAAATVHPAVAGAGPSAGVATVDDVRAAAAPCPAEAAHCFGLIVHVAPAMDGGLVQAPDWIADQVATANRLFTPLGVGFTIVDVQPLRDRDVVIMTRGDRNRLGRDARGKGTIDVFVVGRLGDLDDSGGEINGVHWRRGGKRWIIVAARAWDLTLGHELGHWFGLPHSDVDASLMNTSRRATPASARAFQPDELERMRANLRRLLKSKSLRDRAATDR